ncbi:MAG: SixA phosphatase family protein [Jatrophihabitantaceae bacterium]
MTPHRLVLIRHAKAADGALDIVRPLAPRGRDDAGAIGRFLERAGVAPDLVVVSPALRARQTWAGAQAELAAVIELAVDDRIYDNDVTSLLATISGTPQNIQVLAMVGHNPSFAQLAAALDDGEGDDDARTRMRSDYPTGCIAIFDLAGPWAQVRPGSATLQTFAVPRGRS